MNPTPLPPLDPKLRDRWLYHAGQASMGPLLIKLRRWRRVAIGLALAHLLWLVPTTPPAVVETPPEATNPPPSVPGQIEETPALIAAEVNPYPRRMFPRHTGVLSVRLTPDFWATLSEPLPMQPPSGATPKTVAPLPRDKPTLTIGDLESITF